jgi:C-terminal binding protein
LFDVEVVIVCHGNHFGREQIAQMHNCRGIVVATAGFDHIDLEAAAELAIPVCNVPDYGSEDVADHAILLMLACMRRLSTMLEATRAGDWDWSAAHGARRLRGQTLGIVGLGRIGLATADRAQAFGMRVAYYDPYVVRSDRRDLVKVDSLDSLLAECNVVSIHCPLTKETATLIDARALARLRPGSILINTAQSTRMRCLPSSRRVAWAPSALMSCRTSRRYQRRFASMTECC